jgi:diphosphomevalonate decarboxylase
MTDRKAYVRDLVPLGALACDKASAFAPSNIALCKYWGKKNVELNLPMTPSLSISLGDRGSHVKLSRSSQNSLSINDFTLPPDTPHFIRTFDFLNLFLTPDVKVSVQTRNTIPTAAGLASSASYFAALTLALGKLYNWQLPPSTISCVARLGSGSACRSLYHGFVKWMDSDDPLQSYGVPLVTRWPELRIGLLIFDAKPKSISSRQAMLHTQLTSPFYEAWCENSRNDFELLHAAIEQKDFKKLGKISEYNALSLHAVMLAARPSIIYSQPETIQALGKVHELRRKGIEVYLTQDAGANLKLLFLERDLAVIQNGFPILQVVTPFYHATSAFLGK